MSTFDPNRLFWIIAHIDAHINAMVSLYVKCVQFFHKTNNIRWAQPSQCIWFSLLCSSLRIGTSFHHLCFRCTQLCLLRRAISSSVLRLAIFVVAATYCLYFSFFCDELPLSCMLLRAACSKWSQDPKSSSSCESSLTLASTQAPAGLEGHSGWDTKMKQALQRWEEHAHTHREIRQ